MEESRRQETLQNWLHPFEATLQEQYKIPEGTPSYGHRFRQQCKQRKKEKKARKRKRKWNLEKKSQEIDVKKMTEEKFSRID